MKNKKTIVAIIAVLLVVVVGVTFAYFQSTASFENLFNVGIYKVTTTEVFESPSNWAPGQEIPKTITTTNEGTIPAAVRVSYTEQWLDGDTDITSSITNGTVTVNLDNTSDWTKEGNYYYYNYILEPEQTTSSFMKSVTLSSSINGITCTPSNDGLTQSCESSSPIQGATYKLTITKETVQADSYQEVWNTNVEITEKPSNITYLSRQVEGQITPGDVIGIGDTEDFYVVSSTPEKTVLLAKYNLLVGNINNADTGWDVAYLTPANAGYGLQNEDAIGYNQGGSYIGVVAFSSINYWSDGNSQIASPYNVDDYVYDPTYNSEPNFTTECDDDTNCWYSENYSIAYYVEEYVERLKSMGAPSTITGRLLSYEEADSVKEVGRVDVNYIELEYNSIIFNNQDYWLGTASNDYSVTTVSDDASYFNSSYYYDNYYVCSSTTYPGVRPVIEIPTSELQ